MLGLVSVSVTYSGLILAIEYVDGIWRTIAGMYNLFPLPVSYIMISGIAYVTQDYKLLQLCIGLPGVFLCLLWYVCNILYCKMFALRYASLLHRRNALKSVRHKLRDLLQIPLIFWVLAKGMISCFPFQEILLFKNYF